MSKNLEICCNMWKFFVIFVLYSSYGSPPYDLTLGRHQMKIFKLNTYPPSAYHHPPWSLTQKEMIIEYSVYLKQKEDEFLIPHCFFTTFIVTGSSPREMKVDHVPKDAIANVTPRRIRGIRVDFQSHNDSKNPPFRNHCVITDKVKHVIL